MLTFVHISDLHIGQDGAEALDRDRDPREELILDCERIRSELEGDVSGVLISGDVAHSGDTDQYRQASEWLTRLCGALGTGEENVWTVPGNHDFDQDARTRLWHTACAELRGCNLTDIDRLLSAHLGSRDKDVLLEPLRAYHEFAGNYGCSPPGPVQVWEELFELNDQLKLRVRGLNTAILADGSETTAGDGLILGVLAAQLPREADVFNLAIWHHPPYWLRDQELVTDYLDTRASVHLFGHDHNHALEETDSVLRVSAGALHPRRGTTHWDPRYNLIEIDAAGTEIGDGLDVSVISRRWDGSETRFSAEGGDLSVTRQQFRVGARETAGTGGEAPTDAAPEVELAANASADSYDADQSRQERGRVTSRARLLTLRYATLPYVKRLLIASELDLLEDSDRALTGFEQTRLVLQRAMDRGLLDALWSAVAEQTDAQDMATNPYAASP